MSIVKNWINIKSEKDLPKKDILLLIKTDYCKYPVCTGYYNGVKFVSIDDKQSEIGNVKEYAIINLKSKATSQPQE